MAKTWGGSVPSERPLYRLMVSLEYSPPMSWLGLTASRILATYVYKRRGEERRGSTYSVYTYMYRAIHNTQCKAKGIENEKKLGQSLWGGGGGGGGGQRGRVGEGWGDGGERRGREGRG